MRSAEELGRDKNETEALRERLLRLSEAILRVSGSLDLDAVLSEAVEGARALTAARYGALTLIDDAGEFLAFVTSGLTEEEREALLNLPLPGGLALFDFLTSDPEPMRLADVGSEARELGVGNFPEVKSFLGAPIRNGDLRVGNFYLSEKEEGGEFTNEDEETLALFASQAAAAIANARRHDDERRARAHIEALIDTSPVGVLVLDAKTGRITSINREAMRIVGSLKEVDQSMEELMRVITITRSNGQQVSLDELQLAQTLSEGETVRSEELVFRAPDGRSVTMLTNSTPIRSDEGEVQSVVVTLQDLTPLEELERLRAEFLGMVSHELRAPLTSIKGSATTLIGSGASLDPAEALQFHRIIDEQAERMRELITDLLDVARIETGALSVTPEPTDVVILIDQARNDFLSAGGRESLDIDMELDLPQVIAERRRIAQVLGNLLSNAARHSPEASTIRMGATKDGVHVTFFVADDGIGIAPEFLPHLFSKHSRIDGDDRSGIAGSGLGLAICKGIVEAHGGRIWAESEGSGMGTRFVFTLPAILEVEVAPLPQTFSRPARARRNQPRILVVDDDPHTLRYVRDVLSSANYFPIVTGVPEDVGRLMREERPHLVLLDMMLPGTDGIRIMETVPGFSDVPVIFLSAYGRDQIVARALEAGAFDYVVKPFSPTELVARIQSALRKHAAPSSTEPTEPFVLGDLTINYVERTVFVAGNPVKLTNTEYRLLFELSVNAGRVLQHNQILQRVWGVGHPGHPGPVRTAIKNLRRKLNDKASDPSYIFSESRVGYRMPKADPQQQRTEA